MSAEAKNVTVIEDRPLAAVTTPMEMIGRMIESGADVAQLEKMMDLQERWERNESRKAFAAALSAFQSDCPVIRKNLRGDKATYADLAFTVKTIKPHLNRHGLSVRFDTELTAPNGEPAIMTAICYITHESGHTETNKFACPVDTGPMTRDGRKVMNSAQSTASARSYCKRYALGDALNLVFADEVDDDGESAGSRPIDQDQAAQIREYIESLEIDEPKYLEVLGAASVDEIPMAKFGQAMHLINRKKKAKRNAK